MVTWWSAANPLRAKATGTGKTHVLFNNKNKNQTKKKFKNKPKKKIKNIQVKTQYAIIIIY